MITLLTSSIGQKILMAITGVALFGFVIVHMLGNLQIFLGQDAINHYAEFLHSLGELLWVARGTILAMFVVHIVVSYKLTLQNMAARPEPYVKKNNIQASLPSYYMGSLGTLILVYVAFHLMHFTVRNLDPRFANLVDLHGRYDVYSMVVLGFQSIPISIAYVAAMLVLLAHLWHAIPSFFQTLGIRSKSFTPFIETAGPVIAVAIATGYIAVPLGVLFGIVTLPVGGI